MKRFMKIFMVSLLSAIFISISVNAKINLSDPSGQIEKVSITTIKSSWDIVNDIELTWKSILTTVKVIFEWVILIYIVYIWVQMILSLWNNDEDLSKAKRSIRYSLIWLVFINVPWTIYSIFRRDNYWVINGNANNSWSTESLDFSGNILLNFNNLDNTLNERIIAFIEVWIAWFAVLMITIAWIRILTSRWREDEYKKNREKFIWSTAWLVFVWFIEAWKEVVFTWNIDDGWDLFKSMSDLALFFAWPVAIFFLTIAAYYYITSNGDEERTKSKEYCYKYSNCNSYFISKCNFLKRYCYFIIEFIKKIIKIIKNINNFKKYEKILILIITASIIWLNFTCLNYVNAESWITVTVTEKIPGADCKPDDKWSSYTWTYECSVDPGFWTVTNMMWSIIRYFTFIASLVWVLFIVYNGIMYSMWGIEQTLKDNAKKRIIQTLIWLAVLLLSWVILNLVAPWIYVK